MLEKDLKKSVCEEAVFERIYTKYAKDLSAFLYYKYGNTLTLQDKVQEAFITLWSNCKKVSVAKAKSFLFTVANNMMLNDVKHQKVVLKYKKHKPTRHTNESPEFILEQAQFLERYQKALTKLSEEQRVAFLLNKVEDKKHSEIADMLGVTRKVVEYRIYSAFNILKKELKGFKIK